MLGCRLRWDTLMQAIQRCSLLLCLCVGSACRPATPVANSTNHSREPVQLETPALKVFLDRSVDSLSGCDFHNGRETNLKSILEILGGGISCLDFDNDGNCDLFFSRGGHIDPQQRQVRGLPGRLMKGDGQWGFADSTTQANLESCQLYGHGMTSADWNHDGFEDLLVYGYHGAVLWCNMGDGTFQKLAEDAFQHNVWTSAATWFDVNGDQALDCYLGSYVNWDFDTHQTCANHLGEPDVCSPNAFEGMTSAVFVNNRDGTFSHAPDLLTAPQPTKTLSVLAAEFSPGQGVGLYVANDLIANFLFLNRAGEFEDVAFSHGAAVDDQGTTNASMGLTLLDFDGDQQMDLFVTNFSDELMGLYLNHGQSVFQHASRQVGLNRLDPRLVAFGTVAADFDGDGDEDIIYTCGHVYYQPSNSPFNQPTVYLENVQGKSLRRLTSDCDFFSQVGVGRGLAAADIDNDGDLDLVATRLIHPPKLAENIESPKTWIGVTLVGTRASRTPIGTTVYATLGDVTQTRQLYGGGSYLSQNQSRLYFAWPLDSAPTVQVSLDVHWSDGSSSQYALQAGRQHVVVQP